MKKNKGFAPIVIVLIVIVVLIIIGISYYLGTKNNSEKPIENDFTYSLQDQNKLAQEMPNIPTGASTDLIIKSNIESFMEHTCSFGSGNIATSSSKLYGYDDKYIYAWVYCVEFSSDLKLGSASSIPYRFEYKNPNYLIIGYKQSPDGEGNEIINKEIFGKYYDLMILNHPSNSEIKELEKQALDKAKEVFSKITNNTSGTENSQEKNGKYIGYIKSVSNSGGNYSLKIDYVQWLTSKDAIKAALEDDQCSIDGMTNSQAILNLVNFDISMGFGIYGNCAPDGYYIRNQNTLVRTFQISNSVNINVMTEPSGNALDNLPNVNSISSFKKLIESDLIWTNTLPFWITLNNGIVTEATEQYMP